MADTSSQPQRRSPSSTNSTTSSSNRGMSIDDIEQGELRKNTLALLRIVPTVSVQKAYETLISFNDNVEVAAWSILQEQQKNGNRNLQLNEYVDVNTRWLVYRLRDMFPQANLQECYIAIRVSEGVLDNAVKHLKFMHEKQEKEGEAGFIIDPSWMDEIRY